MGNQKAQSEPRPLPQIASRGKEGFADENDSIFSGGPSVELIETDHKAMGARNFSLPTTGRQMDQEPQMDNSYRQNSTQELKTFETKENEESYSLPREANSSFDSLLNIEVDDNEIEELKEVPIEPIKIMKK